MKLTKKEIKEAMAENSAAWDKRDLETMYILKTGPAAMPKAKRPCARPGLYGLPVEVNLYSTEMISLLMRKNRK